MQQDYALELIEKGKRVDGRKLDDYRPIKIEKGIIKNAEGSTSIKLGETEIIAGVKIGMGTPFADTPNEGTLMVNAEFTPLASPDFESGPPGENAVELARLVDRGLRESKSIDLEKLVIKEGEKVLTVFVDIHIINHQGNLIDAAALAAITALHNTKIPVVEDEKLIRGKYKGELPVKYKPVEVTVCKVGTNLILDPLFEEESIIDCKLTIAVRDDDKICAMQKQGKGVLTIDEIEKMIDLAIKKSKELRKLVV